MLAKRIAMICTALAVVMSTGCATLLSGTEQQVTVTSNPAGARVMVGHQMARTPVTVVLPKGRDIPIHVSQGPDRRVVMLNKSVDPNTWLNLIPPFWPGLLIDASSGAYTRYDPGMVHVDFRSVPPSTNVHVVRYAPY